MSRVIKSKVRNFYKLLYSKKQVPFIQFLGNLVKRISKEDDISLESIPTSEETRQAVWTCDFSHAPGPDGYNFNFIKRC